MTGIIVPLRWCPKGRHLLDLKKHLTVTPDRDERGGRRSYVAPLEV